MPFAIFALGDLIWAIVGALAAIGFGALLRAMVSRLPSIGIPFTSFNTDKLLAGWVDHLADDMFDSVKGALPRIGNWFRGHAYIFGGIMYSLVTVLTHLGDQIAHHQNTTIPDGDSSTLSSANATANQLARNLQNNIDAARSDATNQVSALRSYVDGSFDTGIKQAIDAAESGAEQAAHAELATVESNLAGEIQGVQGAVDNLGNLIQYTVPAEIASAVAAEASRAKSDLSSAVSSLQGEITNLQASINQLGSLITADEARITTAEANIARLQAAAVVDESAIAAQRDEITAANANIAANSQAIDKASGQIDQLTSQLDTVTSSQSIDEANIGTLQNVTSVVLPAAIAGVAADVAAITTEYERCAVTTCDGPNNIEGVLKGLLAQLTTASEVGFIAEAIHDPLGTAAAIAPLLESIDTGANDTLDLLLSL